MRKTRAEHHQNDFQGEVLISSESDNLTTLLDSSEDMRHICHLWKFSVQHLLSFNQREWPENLRPGTDKSIRTKES